MCLSKVFDFIIFTITGIDKSCQENIDYIFKSMNVIWLSKFCAKDLNLKIYIFFMIYQSIQHAYRCLSNFLSRNPIIPDTTQSRSVCLRHNQTIWFGLVPVSNIFPWSRFYYWCYTERIRCNSSHKNLIEITSPLMVVQRQWPKTRNKHIRGRQVVPLKPIRLASQEWGIKLFAVQK